MEDHTEGHEQQARQEGIQPTPGRSYWHGDEPTSLLLLYRRHYAQLKSQLELKKQDSEQEQTTYQLAVQRLREVETILRDRGELPQTPTLTPEKSEEPGKEEPQP